MSFIKACSCNWPVIFPRPGNGGARGQWLGGRHTRMCAGLQTQFMCCLPNVGCRTTAGCVLRPWGWGIRVEGPGRSLMHPSHSHSQHIHIPQPVEPWPSPWQFSSSSDTHSCHPLPSHTPQVHTLTTPHLLQRHDCLLGIIASSGQGLLKRRQLLDHGLVAHRGKRLLPDRGWSAHRDRSRGQGVCECRGAGDAGLQSACA